RVAAISNQSGLGASDGFFKFGEAIAFGRCAGGQQPAAFVTDRLADVSSQVVEHDGRTVLPFDLTEVATNLREERYRLNGYTFLQKTTSGEAVQRLYYRLRPFMGVAVRKQLQRIRLNGWEKIPFPRWPVDVSVDQLMDSVMALLLKTTGRKHI